MIATLVLVAILVGITALANIGTERFGVPHSILLVLVGIALSFAPFMPVVAIDPELVLLLLLPPLLYEAGVGMSWRGFRFNLRAILALAIGCTLFTAAAVAAVVHWTLEMPWAVAFVLGAVVSPPDPVAPMAIAKRLQLPTRLLTVLEGEGLVNDATALILTSFAVAAVVTGSFSLAQAAGGFGLILAGETFWGLGVACAILHFRSWIGNPQVEIIFALLTPFIAFWPPHELGGSGVLAAVVAGLYVSWNGRRLISPTTRLQGYFVWGLIVHLIEGVLFLLIGLQARPIAQGITDGGWQRFAFAAAIVCIVIVIVRFVWVYPATYLPRLLSRSLAIRDPLPSRASIFFIGFTGIRGVVSLAAALSIPVAVASRPFPERDLILFVTFCVILVTLVGQGGVLPWLIRRLGLADAGTEAEADAKGRELSARVEGVRAALRELERLGREGASPAAIAALTRRHRDRLAEHENHNGSLVADDAALQAQLIKAERRRIGELYDESAITDDARRRIERELDLEDARNRHALESATGDLLADPEVEADG